MKLTNRQETFIKNLVEMYLESQEPIHYTVLAERLGVSRFTAYDMMRVLEAKGYVSSEYRLSEAGKPGRSERVFLPTDKAKKTMRVIAGGDENFDWESIKARVMDMMESGGGIDPELTPELLIRVPPENEDRFQYCIEVVTILALQTRQYKEKLEVMNSYAEDFFSSHTVSSRTVLSLFSGFILGVLSQGEKLDEIWMEEMVSHVMKYQEIILEMNDEEVKQLASGIREHLPELFSQIPENE